MEHLAIVITFMLVKSDPIKRRTLYLKNKCIEFSKLFPTFRLKKYFEMYFFSFVQVKPVSLNLFMTDRRWEHYFDAAQS